MTGSRCSTYCTTVEVVLRAQDDRLVLRNTLDLISPLTSDLNTGLDSLCTRVHGQNHIEAEVLSDKLGEAWKDIVVEGTRAQSDPRRLVHESGDQLRVAVALVDRRVCGQEVQVVTTLGVPDRGALSPSEDDGERVVVVGGKITLGLNRLLGGGGVVGTGAVASTVTIGAVCAVDRHVRQEGIYSGKTDGGI